MGPHGVSKDLKLVFMFHDSCKVKILQGDVSMLLDYLYDVSS